MSEEMKDRVAVGARGRSGAPDPAIPLDRVRRALVEEVHSPALREAMGEWLEDGEEGILRAISLLARAASSGTDDARGPAAGDGGDDPAGARDGKAFLEEILAGLRAGLKVIDVDFKIVNPIGRDGGGRVREGGQMCYEEIFSRSEACPDCPAVKVFETGEPERVVAPREGVDGESRFYEIHAFPMKGPGGKVENVIELTRDVTEERMLQERYHASEQLAAAGRLAAGIAHEIKNPLGVILAASQVLTNPRRPAEQRAEASEILVVEVERLSNIVNDFLRYARPGPLRRRRHGINDLVHETVSTWSAGRGEKGAWNLVEDLDPAGPRIPIDRDQLRQVILNLLINAYQAAGEGGSLTIRTRRLDEGGVELSFLDDGPGVPPEVLDKIYEPFFTTKEEGTGLGLSIVRRIVDAHGGEIRMENLTPRGAVCRVRLPEEADEDPSRWKEE